MTMALGSFAGRVAATVVVAQDGSGDFTTIQPAIDSLPATGGLVFIREGTYTITSNILITDKNVSLEGVGHATYIYSTSSIPLISLDNASGTFIRNMRLGHSTNIGYGIQDTGGGVSSLRISNIRFDKNNRAIYLSVNPNRIRIDNCYILHNADWGIYFDTGFDIFITNNHLDTCGDDAIYIVDTSRGVISGNIIEGGADNGIVIFNGSKDVIVSNNVIEDVTNDGISVNGSATELTRRTFIVGNIINNPGADGVDVGADSHDTFVHGNIIYSPGDVDVEDTGTNTTISDNT